MLKKAKVPEKFPKNNEWGFLGTINNDRRVIRMRKNKIKMCLRKKKNITLKIFYFFSFWRHGR